MTINSTLADEMQVRLLYKKLLDCWNNNDAKGYSDLFLEDANLVGFDGSQVNGKAEINDHLSEVFTNHKTATYVSIVREVRSIDSSTCVLRAVAGMVPPGQADINPAVNAIQTLIAVKQKENLLIAVFQNTPAVFHGRPELSEQLTKELRDALNHERALDENVLDII